jgi:predicted amidohydrolase YtcJ
MSGDADLVLVGGKIFTASKEKPWAQALAVRGDRIVAVGTDAKVERWSGRGTKTVDLHGRTMVPGFIDAHSHMVDAATEFGWAHLDGTASMSVAIERMRALAQRTPPGGWVVGVDWDEAKWPERRYFLRGDLDQVSTVHPVVAVRMDGHMGCANTKALELATDLTAMDGVEKDAAGQPTGVMKEDPFYKLHERFSPSEAVLDAGLLRMARKAHRLGITSIHDIVGAPQLRAYQRAHRRGILGLRLYALPRDTLLDSLVAAGLATGLGDSWLRLGAIKVFTDGSLGAYTAALGEPYVGQPENRGILVHSNEELRKIFLKAQRAGFQTATHALGDAAIRQAVETWESILKENPKRDHRHRIEHLELPDDDLLRRMKAVGLLASCQPNFVGQWSGPGDVYESRLGKDRNSMNNPYRRILRRRIPLCFGSDGMPYGPLYGIHSAVNGYFKDQRISVEEAIRAYTAGGAYAAFEENTKGTLEPNKLADFVILDGDPFAEPEGIRELRIHSTWIGGRCVYQSGERHRAG